MEPKNITSEQRRLLNNLSAKNKNFLYEWDEVRGVASYIRSSNLISRDAFAERQKENAQVMAEFMKDYAPLFGAPDITAGLRPLLFKEDNIGWHHLQFQSYLLSNDNELPPIEFYGSKVAAHFMPDGSLVEVQSSCFRDIKIANEIKLHAGQLREQLLKKITHVARFEELKEIAIRDKNEMFPLMQEPRPVIYPWKGEMLHAWATYGYAPYLFDDTVNNENENSKPVLTFGQIFFNAETGELFLFAPTQKGAETPATGSGLGCTPLGGPFVNRSLDIVRVNNSSTYLLKNKTKARDIITFDANANSSWGSSVLPALLNSNTVPVSSDTDGDHNWNRVAANTTDAERTVSQQPEVDEHFRVSALYDWYFALAGRVGWDDNDFSAPLVPDQALNIVAHCFDDGFFSQTSRSVNANFDKQLVNGHWVSRLAFFDGDPTGAGEDYLAGSDAIVGHEYQHAITDFSFKDGMGNPGLTYDDWFAAIHEGTSDVFGGLFSSDWWMASAISTTGKIFRNLAFPRDTMAFDPGKFDHWDDRNNISGTAARYHRGDILAHCAYLMAQGGVHQRSSRSPVLIPVKGLGRETVNGKDFYKAARIWYRGLSLYLSNIGAMSGIPANDENIFRTFRNAVVNAAIDIYGFNSSEHKTTVLAWYAVGLHPAGTAYGPDVTFLTWGADWWMSRPYIGLPSPDWSSVDLFINNGGASEWNAQVNIIDGGTPTQFENQVYCRVRNIGSGLAQNVQIQFQYAKISTSGTTWYPITDKDGNIQVLNTGTLPAGASNFPDSDQNTPPASAMVKWWVPPIETGETVNHYCIKATLFSISDGNPVNNEVQSNVAYVPYSPGSGLRLAFFATNPFKEAIRPAIKINSTLPKGWVVRLIEQLNHTILKPGESIRTHLTVDMPAKSGTALEAPFDGSIKGSYDDFAYTGNLFNASFEKAVFKAQIAINTVAGKHLTGLFEGTLNVETAKFTGILFSAEGERFIEGCLRPSRVINIAQYHKGEPFGGLTMQVQVPLPGGSCFEKLPTTDIYVTKQTQEKEKEKKYLQEIEDIVHCLSHDKHEVCCVKIKAVSIEIRFCEKEC